MEIVTLPTRAEFEGIILIEGVEILMATVMATITLSIAFLFFPAIFELKKPKDAGPRIIADSNEFRTLTLSKRTLLDVDSDFKIDPKLVRQIENSIRFILNLDD